MVSSATHHGQFSQLLLVMLLYRCLFNNSSKVQGVGGGEHTVDHLQRTRGRGVRQVQMLVRHECCSGKLQGETRR